MLCGETTQKTYVAHECWSRDRVIRAERVPSYRCDACDIDTPRLSSCIELLEQALASLQFSTDIPNVRFLREELAAARKQQDESLRASR